MGRKEQIVQIGAKRTHPGLMSSGCRLAASAGAMYTRARICSMSAPRSITLADLLVVPDQAWQAAAEPVDQMGSIIDLCGFDAQHEIRLYGDIDV